MARGRVWTSWSCGKCCLSLFGTCTTDAMCTLSFKLEFDWYAVPCESWERCPWRQHLEAQQERSVLAARGHPPGVGPMRASLLHAAAASAPEPAARVAADAGTAAARSLVGE
jgi:hypothetical protein